MREESYSRVSLENQFLFLAFGAPDGTDADRLERQLGRKGPLADTSLPLKHSAVAFASRARNRAAQHARVLGRNLQVELMAAAGILANRPVNNALKVRAGFGLCCCHHLLLHLRPREPTTVRRKLLSQVSSNARAVTPTLQPSPSISIKYPLISSLPAPFYRHLRHFARPSLPPNKDASREFCSTLSQKGSTSNEKLSTSFVRRRCADK